MWFSPWRRILRGRSGDTKPSGLRAGTKFVEEDTGVEYTYDPVMLDWKKKVAPYSTIVCKDGSTVWAEDASGKTIASGEADVDDASVIQSAINNGGKVFISAGKYIADNIEINNPIIVEGAGRATAIYGKGDNYIFIIGQNGSYDMYNVLSKVVIRDMTVGGQKTQMVPGVIDAAYTDHLQIENLYIPYVYESAIFLRDWQEFTQIRNVRVFGSSSSFCGINAHDGYFLYVNNFQACAAKGQGTGIYLEGMGDLKFEQIGLSSLDKCIVCLSTKINVDTIWIESAYYGFYVKYGYGGIVKGLHNAGDVDTLEYYEATDYRIQFIPTYKTKMSGVATFSGDGTTTDFLIGAHGLYTTDPEKIIVRITPVSSDAIDASPCVGYVDLANNSRIRVKFSNPPASGSENVKIIWEAEVRTY